MMLCRRRAIAKLFSACLLGGFAAGASGEKRIRTETDWFQAHASRVRLIAGGLPKSSNPAAPLLAGVEIQLDAKWKTYWRMPGEAGVPPQFDWSKSENVAQVEVLYPAPKRYPDKGGDAVGYDTHVIFPLQVMPKDPGKPALLAIEMAFGVCKDICVPLETSLNIGLPAAATGVREVPQALSAMLDRVPRSGGMIRAADPVVTSVSGAIAVSPGILTIVTGAAVASDVFVEGPDGFFVPLTRRGATGSGASTFTVDFSKLSDAKDLIGKPLRITVIGPTGASETVFTPKQ